MRLEEAAEDSLLRRLSLASKRVPLSHAGTPETLNILCHRPWLPPPDSPLGASSEGDLVAACDMEATPLRVKRRQRVPAAPSAPARLMCRRGRLRLRPEDPEAPSPGAPRFIRFDDTGALSPGCSTWSPDVNYNRLQTPEPTRVAATSPSYDPQRRGTFFDQVYAVHKYIGEGSFGQVLAATSRDDKRLCAVKKLPRGVAAEQEIYRLSKLRCHPNIVHLIEAWEEENIVFIKTELCNESLSIYADRVREMPIDNAYTLLYDIIMALEYVHSNSFVHLDVKPANILIQRRGKGREEGGEAEEANHVYKLADFGIVYDLETGRGSPMCSEGDVRYAAAELLGGVGGDDRHPTPAADIFSFGLTIFEMVTGCELPSGGDAAWKAVRLGVIPDEMLMKFDETLLRIVTSMMQPDPQRRPTCKEVIEHADFRDAIRSRHAFLRARQTESDDTSPLAKRSRASGAAKVMKIVRTKSKKAVVGEKRKIAVALKENGEDRQKSASPLTPATQGASTAENRRSEGTPRSTPRDRDRHTPRCKLNQQPPPLLLRLINPFEDSSASTDEDTERISSEKEYDACPSLRELGQPHAARDVTTPERGLGPKQNLSSERKGKGRIVTPRRNLASLFESP